MNRLWLVFILAPSTLAAQDWHPILNGRKYNYKPDTAEFIQFGVWIDSVSWSGTDSVYYLNRIVTDCDTCLVPGSKLRDQGTFFHRKMQSLPDGSFWFHDPGSFLLRARDTLNATWLFDTAQNISATIVSVFEDSLFGISDSFKTLALSTGDTIVIGKNLGVVRFPTADSTIHYTLTGIDMGPIDLGETVIDFWDVYDLKVGDIFQFFDGEGSCHPCVYDNRWERFEVLGAGNWVGETVEFATEYYYYEYHEHWIYGVFRTCGSGSIKTFDKSQFRNIDAYPSELVPWTFQYLGWQPEYYCVYQLQRNDQGRVVKHCRAGSIHGFEGVLYYQGNYPVLLPDSGFLGIYDHSSSFGESMGLLTDHRGGFESYITYETTAMVLDGDTIQVSEPLRDSAYYLTPCPPDYVNAVVPNRIIVRPNPASGLVHVPYMNNRPAVLHLMDVQGRLALSSDSAGPQTQLDLSPFPSGLYILTATSPGGQLLWSTKVIKQ